MNEIAQGTRGPLIWTDACSVNVKEIDEQHKHLFAIINDLIRVISATPKEEEVKKIIERIIEYKKFHFATEEKYFHLFNYEGTQQHEAAHRMFDEKIGQLRETYKDDVIGLAFALVDFLEDWLIGHTLTVDKKYTQCFNEHGLY